MSSNEYILAWVAYLGSFAVCYAVFWYFTSKLPWRELRQLLRVLVAVFFLVPWTTDTTHSFLSPAWLVSISDSLLFGSKAFWRAGLALVLALILAVLVSAGVSIFLWLRHRKSVDQSVSVADADETGSQALENQV